jgi:large subunit ribosomal protein L21e
MVKTSKGLRAKTRGILKRKARERGLSPITRALNQFNEGDKVSIKLDPSIHKGQVHRRFQGMTGVITEVRGNAYMVEVSAGDKQKSIIVRPEHLRKQ